MTIKTPEWVIAMTDREYKAFVEDGIFPDRLEAMREESRKKRSEARKERRQKREESAA